MGTITDPEQASTVATSVCDALRSLADAEFSKFDQPALLAFAPTLERITRLTFAAQLRRLARLPEHAGVAPRHPEHLRA